MSQAIDLTLLRVMKHRKDLTIFKRKIDEGVLNSVTKIILKDFALYFEAHPECEVIPLTGEFPTWFKLAHPKILADKLPVYLETFREASKELDPIVRANLMELILDANLADKVSTALLAYNSGDEVELRDIVNEALTEYDKALNREVKVPFIAMDDNALEEQMSGTGFTWAYEGLNAVMRPMVGGDATIVAARPDKGKTTFLCDNARIWVTQLPELFPDDWRERSVVWFNNEGKGERIITRFVQSVLGVPMSRLRELKQQGKLWAEYDKRVPHRRALQVIDIHGYKHWQIEDILKQCKPALIVFDMVDNIRFDGLATNGGTRTDQMLEAMYSWARELSCIHNVPVVETSQLSGDAEGLAWPTMGMLKDSRTGKQGACDAILNIGSVNEQGASSIRYISLTKNKLRVEGKPQSCRLELILDNEQARFIE